MSPPWTVKADPLSVFPSSCQLLAEWVEAIIIYNCPGIDPLLSHLTFVNPTIETELWEQVLVTHALCTVQRHLGKQCFDGTSKKLSGRVRLSYTLVALRHLLSPLYNNVRLLSPPISKLFLIHCLEFLEDTFFSLWTVTKYLITSINSAWTSMTCIEICLILADKSNIIPILHSLINAFSIILPCFHKNRLIWLFKKNPETS